jgi:hypothetical protein
MTALHAHPGRTLRIGVTGARVLDPGQHDRLRTQVTALLQAIAAGAQAEGAVKLELLSPLAEGADRLVAGCALDPAVGGTFELVCPMPFPRGEYEKDFGTQASLDAFAAFLDTGNPRILELDGQRVSGRTHPDGTALTPDEQARADRGEEARAYEAVGRLIVRNCDLLIGIWDGLPGQGRGGTADIVRYAASFGPPVIWLHAGIPAAPRWIEELHDLRPNAPARGIEEPLDTYLGRLLRQPRRPHHGGDSGLLHKIGHLLGKLTDFLANLVRRPPPASPLAAFLREKEAPAWGPWKLHSWLMNVLGGSAPWTPPRPPEDPTARLWFDRYHPADERAGESAKRYRSSYVWVFALGAVALSAAAVSLASAEHPALKITATSVEIVVLALIAFLVIADGKMGWQRRAIEYRLVAELCRKQQALAPLAWVVPRASAWATTEPHPHGRHGVPQPEPIPWMFWLFSAWLRDTPLPAGQIDAVWVERARDAALRDLVDDQIDYHIVRRDQSYRAGKRLVRLGEWGFFIVLALVIWKLWLLLGPEDPAIHTHILWLGLAGAILPAFAAMFVGIRAYAELEMLAEQSAETLKVLQDAKREITELDPRAPLASQTLGIALAAVATAMLQDLEGWARLFRGKVLDA